MSEAIAVALISGLCVGLPSLIATLVSNRNNIKQAEENKNLTLYRINQLESKVDKHNSVVERTFRLEGQVTEIFHDIKELKSYHKKGEV